MSLVRCRPRVTYGRRSYRFVEDPLGDQSRCAYKRANRHPRLGAVCLWRSSSNSPNATQIKLPLGASRGDQHALPHLQRYSKVQIARYLHDACYAANENLSAVESSAVLNCSWALGKLWSPALVTWTCALWSSKLACLLELNGSRRSE